MMDVTMREVSCERCGAHVTIPANCMWICTCTYVEAEMLRARVAEIDAQAARRAAGIPRMHAAAMARVEREISGRSGFDMSDLDTATREEMLEAIVKAAQLQSEDAV